MISDRSFTALSQLISEYDIPYKLDRSDFVETEKDVVAKSTRYTQFGDAIRRGLAPPVAHAECYHYTSGEALLGISETNTFRLTKLTELVRELEYVPYALKSNFGNIRDGISQDQTDGIYVGSFAEIGRHNEEMMWDQFSKQRSGVRIHINVSPKLGAFFRVKYDLNSIHNYFKDRTSKNLVFGGTWYAPAFFVSKSFAGEGEFRLLHTIEDSASRPDCIAVALNGVDPVAALLVTGVEVGANASPAERAGIITACRRRGWHVFE